MVYVTSPELYRRYRKEILELSNRIQTLNSRGLTAKEAAQKLGISEDDVREIQCIAEKDQPLKVFRKAQEFKTKRLNKLRT